MAYYIGSCKSPKARHWQRRCRLRRPAALSHQVPAQVFSLPTLPCAPLTFHSATHFNAEWNIDGGVGPGEFNEPCGLCVSPDGLLLIVADSGNHHVQILPVARRWGAFLALLAVLLCCARPVSADWSSPIAHIVVLMMENRSFDHLLGWLMSDFSSRIDGLKPGASAPRDPRDPSKGRVAVTRNGSSPPSLPVPVKLFLRLMLTHGRLRRGARRPASQL